MLLLGLALSLSGCKKSSPQASTPNGETPAPEEAKRPDAPKQRAIEGLATWYDVPENSLPKRRAGKDELTASHNRLPFGTLVRVTHLTNGKNVIVRITDRGISARVGIIDLCKEAAEELDMLREGTARVRLEILPDDKGTTAVPDSKAAALQR